MKRTRLKTITMLLAMTACIILHAEDGRRGSKNSSEQKTEATEVIKPTVPANPRVTSFSGGFILSRVILLSADDLFPYADKQSEDYSEQRHSFAGLVVFHTGGGESALPKGMYVWDGDKWQRVSYDL
jgi:hypothetical protein